MPIDPREWSDPFGGPADGVGVVAIAASAGGLEAFSRVLAALPGDFPAPVVLVQHIRPDQPCRLPAILARRTALRVEQAEEGRELRRGTVYTPAPDRHLLVNRDGTLSLRSSPKVQFVRPSADVLFESVAAAFGARSIAVVLTGGMRDGAQGVRAVRGRGGFVIAQDAKTSRRPEMPAAAVETRKVDLVLPPDQIAFALRTLAMPASPARIGRAVERLGA